MTEADPSYDDSSWKQSDNPREMGADGNIDAYAWYRAEINVRGSGVGVLHLKGGDRLRVYINGKYVDYADEKAKADFCRGPKPHCCLRLA